MNIVIIGAGLAGVSAAQELRAQGHTGEIHLIGAEVHAPYERPPLSKDVLLGRSPVDSVFAHPGSWYTEHQINLVTGTEVTELDLDHRQVTLGTGERLAYDRVLIATGSRPRHLALADQSGAPVLYLRTLDDALELSKALTGHILIIGAGWIGLEVAAAARTAGERVTVVETATLPLAGVLGPELGEVFADLHREHGVDLRLGTSVESISHDHERTAVRLSDGEEIHPDLIVVAIGAEPNDELGDKAGLTTDNGILVDDLLRASDPHIYAAGDVANQDHPTLGPIRVEHWDNAIHQGQHAARTMLGDDSPYDRQPYFFTDQYDLGMEYVGHLGPRGWDEVLIRHESDRGALTALWVRDHHVVAGMHINDWDAIDPIRTWIGKPETDELRDLKTPLVEVPVPDQKDDEPTRPQRFA